MSNTTISLRSSGVSGNTPSLGVLANGELSLNFADGILYYKTSANTLGSIYKTPPAGLNQEIQFNDSGSFGGNSSFTFNKSTGYFKAPIIESTNNGNGTNFKVGDDAWIGDVNQSDTLRIAGQQNSANAYIIFGSSDTSKLGRAGTGALTYTGAFTATGTVSGSELTSTLSSGDEGGQINLAIPVTNTSLTGQVTIDIYQNKLRFFQGDSAKCAYIDLTSASAGVGTNLLNPTSSPDTVARDHANAAFNKANSANVLAQSSYDYANTVYTYSSSAYAQANTANTRAYLTALKAGDTFTGNVTVTANVTAANIATQTYIQFGDGSRQYTANSGSGSSSNSFGVIYTSNNSTYANATTANAQVNFVGVAGIAVFANSTTKTITVAGTPGAQGLTVDYGYVYESLDYSIDYGTL